MRNGKILVAVLGELCFPEVRHAFFLLGDITGNDSRRVTPAHEVEEAFALQSHLQAALRLYNLNSLIL